MLRLRSAARTEAGGEGGCASGAEVRRSGLQGVLSLGGGRLQEMLTGGLLSARSVELGPGLQPVLRSESVGIADGRGRSQRCKECRRSCKNISWSYYLPQSSPVSRISASQPLRGPLWALRFNILAPAMQRRRHPSLQPGPALPPAHELLELVVLRPPGFPVMPGALGRQRTTTPSRLRSGSLRHRLPGTRVPRWRQNLDFKSQEASHIRFPGAGVAPRLPVCSALISFRDHHLLLKEASPGRHIPERSRAGVGRSLRFGVWWPTSRAQAVRL